MQLINLNLLKTVGNIHLEGTLSEVLYLGLNIMYNFFSVYLTECMANIRLQQRHATLPILKFDIQHREPPSRAPFQPGS